MKKGAVGLLWAVLILTTTWTAHAEETSSSAQNAAGWAVVGIGSSIGLGSVTTGAVILAGGGKSDRVVGSASLAGGGATILLSVIIGVPLILSSSGNNDKKRNEAVLDAVSGRFRW